MKDLIYTGEYNYKFVYITPHDGKRHIKTNAESMTLERVMQELKELYWGADEINATIIETKIIAVRY